jgi:hypothetical protein
VQREKDLMKVVRSIPLYYIGALTAAQGETGLDEAWHPFAAAFGYRHCRGAGKLLLKMIVDFEFQCCAEVIEC